MRNLNSRTLLFTLIFSGLQVYAWAQMPKEIHTGNPAADDAAHVREKTQWIKEHPEEYRKLGGNPAVVLGNPSPPNEVSPSTPKPLFSAINTYQLANIQAVAAGNSNVAAEELARETQSVLHEFPIGKTHLQFGEAEMFRLSVEEKVDLRGREIQNAEVVEWQFDIVDCPACAKTIYLTMIAKSGSGRKYLMKGEDENSRFDYVLEFEAITNK
jgi:hypothetical protein